MLLIEWSEEWLFRQPSLPESNRLCAYWQDAYDELEN